MAGEAKEPTGPIDEYDWDSQYFSTLDEVVAKLSKTHGEVKGMYSSGVNTVLLFADKGFTLYTHSINGTKRVYWVVDKNQNVDYPIGLPSDTTIITLPAGTTLYRMRTEAEGPNGVRPRFYAERSTFKFSGVASRYGRLYEYKLLQDVRIVNFNKRWRSRLWGGDRHNFTGEYSTYEHIIKLLCEKYGALGWRACVWKDQHPEQQTKTFVEADKEFEVALFSSEIVDSGRLIQEYATTWKFKNTPLRF